MKPTPQTLYDLIGKTWPPARTFEQGPWVLRDGQGGGKRVSSATAVPGWSLDHIEQAEKEMQALDQNPLFMIRDGEEELDQGLGSKDYEIIDPVWLKSKSLADIDPDQIDPNTANIWPPLAVQKEIWSEGGIGASSLNIMARVKGPKTAVFARDGQQSAGAGFVAIHNGIAMLHALEVRKNNRGKGISKFLMAEAMRWSKDMGASHLSLLVVKRNGIANGLYDSLGFDTVGQYHYRIKQAAPL